MPLRLAVTDAALAARCQRQFALACEGIRGASRGAGIGTAVHQALEAFVLRAAHEPGLKAALEQIPIDESQLQQAVWRALYAAFFEQAPAFIARHGVDELIDLGVACHALSAFLGTLLLRARKSGQQGELALTDTLLSSEREIAWSNADAAVELRGRIDLLCRDLLSNELYVVDLKSGLTDVAAEAQALMYALALRQEGVQAVPALVHVEAGQQGSGGRLRLIKVAMPPDAEQALSLRLETLRRISQGQETPQAASDRSLCPACPVRRACWERWGPTVSLDAAHPAAAFVSDSASGAGDSLADEARRLERVLKTRRIPVVEIDPARATVGPSVVRFRVKLREGGSLARIEQSAPDLQRDMSWASEPLVQNDGSFVAIDAPRPDRDKVPWSLAPKLDGLRVPVGLALDRSPLEVDLADAPHLLVAGSTGSGKTVFLQSLLVALLERKSTQPCELVIVDPKMVDFAAFDSRSLQRPVITDPAEAVELLVELAEGELPRRTERLRKLKLNHRSQLPAGELPMPARVVVIDEFADLVQSLTDKKRRDSFLGSVQRVLQKARFAGIHLVIATQRPSAETIPGLLKVNLDVRVAFRLPDAVNSRVVLDEAGAERLLGRGDLLFKKLGSLTRAQGFLVDRTDIERAATRA